MPIAQALLPEFDHEMASRRDPTDPDLMTRWSPTNAGAIVFTLPRLACCAQWC